MSSSLFSPKIIKLGEGCLQEVGKIAKNMKGKHLFVVTGQSFLNGPYLEIFHNSIQMEGLRVTYFSNFKGEPTTEHLRGALGEIEKCSADCVVAIGGGSAIDLAKAISVFAVNRELNLDTIDRVEHLERLPFIAVPTTAGTGSEATKVMVITDVESNVKKNPGHPSLIPDAAILDPQLTLTLPKKITSYTGLDALAHAIEAYGSTRATAMSDHFALEAIRMICEALPVVVNDSSNIKAREQMLLASTYAGIAFSNASTNLAHAMARPLGARFHMPHGLSVALLLPFVIEYGLDACGERYATISQALDSTLTGSGAELANELVKKIRQYNTDFSIWSDSLSYLGQGAVIEENLSNLIRDALSGNGIATNHKVPTEKDIEYIYLQLVQEINTFSMY